jgi:MoxR-like ATPase
MDNRAARFNPPSQSLAIEGRRDPEPGDLRDGSIYVYDQTAIDAVKVALAAGRPLLISGPPGSGKSSLAPNVARHLQWRYYSVVVSSRTQALDLLWTFDSVRRLADAQAQQLQARQEHYVEPGVLWWAFDPASARRRGIGESESGPNHAIEPNELSMPQPADRPAVVLLDEIDKADPDVPNDLLVPLGSYEFRIPNGSVRAHEKPLVIITTNRERDLPPAFKRRCIELELQAPDEKRLIEIAKRHFGTVDQRVYEIFAERTRTAAKQAKAATERLPSTAEFLDAIHAWRGLRTDTAVEQSLLDTITKLTIRKPEFDHD